MTCKSINVTLFIIFFFKNWKNMALGFLFRIFWSGNSIFSLFQPPMKPIGFQEQLLKVICFMWKVWEMDQQHVHFFQIECTWLGVCGSTSSDFLEFNKIGVDANIWSMIGYQTWIGQNVTTIIPFILNCFTFERALGMTEIGGNAQNVKWAQSILNASYTLPLDLAQMMNICWIVYWY